MKVLLYTEKEKSVRITYVNKSLLDLGVEEITSPFGSIIKVYDIDWDDDGECPNLPKDLTIINPSTELIEATDGFDDCLADYLSDKYGCPVYEFKAKVEIYNGL